MFDFAGLFSQNCSDDDDDGECGAAEAVGGYVTYTVYKDGQAFAILNAVPRLAARTVAGFRMASPDSAWVYEAA